MGDASRLNVVKEATDLEPSEVGPGLDALHISSDGRGLIIGYEEGRTSRVGTSRIAY